MMKAVENNRKRCLFFTVLRKQNATNPK